MMGGPGGRPDGMEPPEGFAPENMERPEGFEPGEMPESFNPGNMERPEPPEGENLPMIPAELPEGMKLPEGTQPHTGGFDGGRGPGMGGGQKATEPTFTIRGKENYFSGVGELSE